MYTRSGLCQLSSSPVSIVAVRQDVLMYHGLPLELKILLIQPPKCCYDKQAPPMRPPVESLKGNFLPFPLTQTDEHRFWKVQRDDGTWGLKEKAGRRKPEILTTLCIYYLGVLCGIHWMYLCMRGCVFMCRFACRDQRSEVGIFLCCPSPYFLRSGFSLSH